MLIAFEGGDRCGKTTQIAAVFAELKIKTTKTYVTLKHPDRSTPSGKIIDRYLKREIELSNEAITLCLTSNLWDTSFRIKNELDNGNIVLIDRYIHTNLAYSQVRGISIEKLNALMTGIREPDVVIYLRPSNRDHIAIRNEFGAERYETVEIQNRVQKNFDELLRGNQTCLEIDSCKSIPEITQEIVLQLEKFINF